MSRLFWLFLTLSVATGVYPQNSPIPARTIFQEAAESARLIAGAEKRNYAASELAYAQARAGFLSEAIATTTVITVNRDLVIERIAELQARCGKYNSALEVAKNLSTPLLDQVRKEIGTEQARRGQVTAAMQTSRAMADGYAKEEVLYFITLELLRQGKRAEAEAIASRIKTAELQVSIEYELKVRPTTDWRVPPPPPPSSVPSESSLSGKYSEAISRLRADDVDGAVRCIESEPNSADRSSHFARLSKSAAEMGNLDAALAIARRVTITGAAYEQEYLAGALPTIGELFAKKDLNSALHWARGLSSPYQRTFALIGIAGAAEETQR